ncbi:hypothetical protein BVRB_4g092020 [Beta vulgaris subsp. vulgaris]|nr:hypothetical protein BVRB_4g092020 [Beta vulgaris subsp. vulgaris]
MYYSKKLQDEVDSDWISELPQHINHHILSLLPIEDAIRTSVLSKTWKSVFSSYNIVQSLHFDQNLFALELLVFAESGQEPTVQELRDSFMKFVNNCLLTIKQQESPVLKLTLNVVVFNAESSDLDRLMNLVRQIKVEELCIFVQTKASCWHDWYDERHEEDTCYDFPYPEIVFSSKWLQSLTVRGCRLSLTAGNYVVGMYSSLRHLWLSRVLVADEETLTNLASSCPWIEIIEFESCTFGMETLTLSIFHKLKNASLADWMYGQILEVDIKESVNLESFHCSAPDMELSLNSASGGGRNIKELTLLESRFLFEDLTAIFPLLEKANIEIKDSDIDWFKAANYHLRKLRIKCNTKLQEIHVDCPNLRYFKYRGRGCEKVFVDCPNLRELRYKAVQVPSSLELNIPTDKCVVQFLFYLDCKFNTSWFVWLKEEYVLNEFGATIQPSQQNKVHLTVAMQKSSINQAFVDRLIWSTYPTTLTIHGGCDIVEYLCEILASKCRDGCCCKQFCIKCWWHNVEDVKASSGTEDMKENLASMVEMHKTSTNKSSFTFKWRFESPLNGS